MFIKELYNITLLVTNVVKEYKKRDEVKRSHKRSVMKRAVIRHYSNNTMSCICCGEDQYDFLCVDHINSNGAEHRKKEPNAVNIHQYLYNRNYPLGFQILCFNCNMSRNKSGLCIHQIIREKTEIYNE